MFLHPLDVQGRDGLIVTKPHRSAWRNNASWGLLTFPRGIAMHERVPPRGWIERRSIERHSPADTPLQVIGMALCAYGKPTSVVFAQRGTWAAPALGVLTKPNRSRAERGRKSSPNK